jgi:hypothetical protein
MHITPAFFVQFPPGVQESSLVLLGTADVFIFQKFTLYHVKNKLKKNQQNNLTKFVLNADIREILNPSQYNCQAHLSVAILCE